MLTLTAPDTMAAYIRVSTWDQRTESQREEISRWLKNHGIDPNSIQWFEDKETGKTLDRPGFHELRGAIFAGKVKTVIVWKLDRISRNMRDGMTNMWIWLNQGIGIISISQQLDLSGVIGQMVAAVLFGVAEMELQNTKERQAAGIALAKKRGVYKGRKRGTTKVKPEDVVRLLQSLTVDEVATLKGVTPRTIKNALARIDLTKKEPLE